MKKFCAHRRTHDGGELWQDGENALAGEQKFNLLEILFC